MPSCIPQLPIDASPLSKWGFGSIDLNSDGKSDKHFWLFPKSVYFSLYFAYFLFLNHSSYYKKRRDIPRFSRKLYIIHTNTLTYDQVTKILNRGRWSFPSLHSIRESSRISWGYKLYQRQLKQLWLDHYLTNTDF